MQLIRRGIVSVGRSLSLTGQWARGLIESMIESGEGMNKGEQHNIIPLRRLANSVESSLVDGNDRDLAWDREISTGGNLEKSDSDQGQINMPKELHFISLKEGEK